MKKKTPKNGYWLMQIKDTGSVEYFKRMMLATKTMFQINILHDWNKFFLVFPLFYPLTSSLWLYRNGVPAAAM